MDSLLMIANYESYFDTLCAIGAPIMNIISSLSYERIIIKHIYLN